MFACFAFLVPNATWCLKMAKVPEEAPGPESLKGKSSWKENRNLRFPGSQ